MKRKTPDQRRVRLSLNVAELCPAKGRFEARKEGVP